MRSSTATNLKQVNVLIDAWVQRLNDLAPDLVDSPCWAYTPNTTKSCDGFIPYTDGGGVFEGFLNVSEAQSGSTGEWANRMRESAYADAQYEGYEVGSDECYDYVDEWLSDVDLRIKFQCFFFDRIGNSNSSSPFSGRMMDEPHFFFDVFADPDEYGRNKGTFGDWEKTSVAIADLTEERMEAIAESQIKYFKEQMLGRKS